VVGFPAVVVCSSIGLAVSFRDYLVSRIRVLYFDFEILAPSRLQ